MDDRPLNQRPISRTRCPADRRDVVEAFPDETRPGRYAPTPWLSRDRLYVRLSMTDRSSTGGRRTARIAGRCSISSIALNASQQADIHRFFPGTELFLYRPLFFGGATSPMLFTQSPGETEEITRQLLIHASRLPPSNFLHLLLMNIVITPRVLAKF